jgi:hypothetical protein
MLVTELNREAFDNALSYAATILSYSAFEIFVECENQEVAFEDFCIENDVQFNKNGTPE